MSDMDSGLGYRIKTLDYGQGIKHRIIGFQLFPKGFKVPVSHCV